VATGLARSVGFDLFLPRVGDDPRQEETLDCLYRGIADCHGRYAGPVRVDLRWHGAGARHLRLEMGPQLERFRGTSARAHNTLIIVRGSLERELNELCASVSAIDAAEVVLELCAGEAGSGRELEPEPNTLAALQRLQTVLPNVSCALVLSRANVHRCEEMFALMQSSTIESWRLHCPPESPLEPAEVRRAFEQLMRLMLGSPGPMRMQPLRDCVQRVLAYHDPKQPCRFQSRRSWERSFAIAANGDVFGPMGAHGAEPAYGNLLRAPLREILESTPHQHALAASERRQAATCSACRFYGSCPGDAVAESLFGGRDLDVGQCPVTQPFLESIDRYLRGASQAAPGRDAAQEQGGLREGVRVRALGDGSTPLGSRLRLSTGTCAPSPQSDLRYLTGALLPCQSWRSPTAAECGLLTATRADRTGAPSSTTPEVALFRPPDRVLLPLRAICAECGLYAQQPPAGASATEHPDWQAALAGLFEYLQPYCLDHRPIEATTLYRAEGGLPTVTKTDRGDPEREALTGLHLDSWEGASLRKRTGARNRICVNLGEQERYLLFVNLTLAEMMRELGLRDDDDLREVTLFAGHKFLRRFPDYPVVRVALAPFEAYLAPTGNIVHDGAAPTDRHPDLALHLLGQFIVPAS
jgi:radical SAM protein with 4Fe4S-binding SPASM domain